MLRKLLTDIAFIQGLNLLIKPIWILVIDRAVQNQLPAKEYGNYFVLFNFTLMFFILLDLGLTSYNVTEVSRDNKLSKKIAGNVLGVKILLIVVYLICLLTIGKFIGYNTQEFGLLLWLALIQIITSFNQYFRSLIAAWQKFKVDGVFMVLDRLILIALCGLLIWGNLSFVELSINTFVWAQLIGLGTVLLCLILYVLPKMKGLKIDFGLKHIFPMLRKSLPFALLFALMGLYSYLDGVMLKSIQGDEAGAEYALGYRLFMALSMFAAVFSQVLLPFFSKNNKDRAITRRVANYVSKLLIWFGIMVAFVCCAYRHEVMEMLYPYKKTILAGDAFSIMMFGFIGATLIVVYGTLLTAHRKLKILNWAALATVLLNIILNSYLIPEQGVVGASIATLVSQFTFGIICFVVAVKYLNVNFNLKEVGMQLAAVAVLFVSVFYLKQYLSSPVVHLVVIAITSLISAYLFRLLEKKHLTTLLRK